MSNYSKLIAAILGAVAARLILKWTGLDVAALGVGAEFNDLVAIGVETLVTLIGGAIAGVVVYFAPANKPKSQPLGFQGENG
jgi:hypothetical protein